MTAKKLIVVLFALGVVGAPAVVHADTEAEAKAAYKRGKDFYKEGKYAEAILELRNAYKLKPHPALLRYMGDAFYKLNKAREAILLYKRYLKEAPEAADREKIESKVRQLELIIGSEDEQVAPPPPPPQAPDTAPPPAVAPAPVPGPEPGPEPAPADVDMTPTGEDKEVPVALQQKRITRGPQRPVQRDEGTSALSVFKWITLGLAVGGLAMGITFNRLAAGKASELEDAVINSCPPANPNCGGNPDMNDPKIAFDKSHFDLQQEYKRNQTISLAMFGVGGAAAAASVIMFIVDRPKKEVRPTPRRVSLTPVMGGGTVGLAGEVTF
jgi:hypothetical protein